jgi:hypothetical protein
MQYCLVLSYSLNFLYKTEKTWFFSTNQIFFTRFIQKRSKSAIYIYIQFIYTASFYNSNHGI